MKPVHFFGKAFQDYQQWLVVNREVFQKINTLIFDIDRDPFRGLGKPEPLKGNLQGWWSRRVTDEHRLIYRVEKDVIYVLSVHGHYKNVERGI